MRKDLKIGLAVGGVLLAVLIVYAIVPKGKSPEQLTTIDPAVQQPAEAPTDPVVTGDTGEPTDIGSTDDSGTGAEDPTAIATDTGEGQPHSGAADQASAEQRDEVARGEADDPFQSGDVPTGTGGDTTGAAWEQLVPLMTETPERDDASSSTEIAAKVGQPDTASEDRAELARGDEPASASFGATETLSTESDIATNDALTIDTSPSTPVSTGSARTHIMQRGETYSSIAKLVYGNAKYFRAIEEANPNLDPTRLRPGTEIRLPDPATVKAGETTSGSGDSGASAAAERTIDASKEYRVESGDSLYKISVKRFGDASRTNEIYELNKQLIGDDPSRLKVGMILKLPNAGASAASASSR